MSNQHVPGHIRKPEIAQNHVEIATIGQVDRLAAAAGGHDVGAFHAQKDSKDLPDIGGVFHQEDALSLETHQIEILSVHMR